MTREISSAGNQWARRFRLAIDRHDDEIVIEGPKHVRDAIALGWRPIAVATDPRHEGFEHATLRFSTPLFRSLSGTLHSQGVIALFKRPTATLSSALDAGGMFVALDRVQDPGNTGMILRLACAFEASAVLLLEGCADPFGPKAIRASAGTILQVPLVQTTREDLLDAAKARKIHLFAAEKTTTVPSAGIPTGDAIIIFGSEGEGVSKDLRLAATPLSITISPRVESLNVAAAAAILLSRIFEKRRA